MNCVPASHTLVLGDGVLIENRRELQRDLKLLMQRGPIQEVGAGATDPTKCYEPVTSCHSLL